MAGLLVQNFDFVQFNWAILTYFVQFKHGKTIKFVHFIKMFVYLQLIYLEHKKRRQLANKKGCPIGHPCL